MDKIYVGKYVKCPSASFWCHLATFCHFHNEMWEGHLTEWQYILIRMNIVCHEKTDFSV